RRGWGHLGTWHDVRGRRTDPHGLPLIFRFRPASSLEVTNARGEVPKEAWTLADHVDELTPTAGEVEVVSPVPPPLTLRQADVEPTGMSLDDPELSRQKTLDLILASLLPDPLDISH